MKFKWIKQSGNDKIIVFFNGWGMDERPFSFLETGVYDLLMIYDYVNLKIMLPDLSAYREKFLLAWSSGVRIADLIINGNEFKKRIAINGTAFTVDNDKGIHPNVFFATIKHFSPQNRDKFYRRMILKQEDYKRFTENLPARALSNQKEELEAIYSEKDNRNPDNIFDIAIISQKDKIIPSEKQEKYWSGQFSKIVKINDCGHFPFYRWKSWREIFYER